METGLFLVFLLIGISFLLFVTEWIPIDVTAIGLMVTLILLGPWTGVSPEKGVSGFSNPATLTVLAMFMLSEGIRQTGAVKMLIGWIESFTGTNENRSLLALFGLAGPPSGIMNNTPVVAVLIPVARKLAQNVGVSPSRFLMPLSFISMLGGTLTLIGTSSTILASDISHRILGRPISMFEFTHLGLLILIVGAVYLFTLGRYLIPDRVRAEENLVEEFDLEEYLTDVRVLEESDLVGRTVRQLLDAKGMDLDVLQIIREGKILHGPLSNQEIQPGDVLVIRASRETLMNVLGQQHLEIHPVGNEDLPKHIRKEAQPVSTETPESVEDGTTLVEVVLLPTCSLVGQNLTETDFRRQYDASVLAIRRGGEVIRERMKHTELRSGDTLLLQAAPEAVERISRSRGYVVSGTDLMEGTRTGHIPVALGIMAGVIVLPALDMIPIMVSALTGVFAMLVTGCMRPHEAYDAIQWDVIFLLAGVIPLGHAMEHTAADQFLADTILTSSTLLPTWGMLLLIYLITTVLTNIISNTATVVFLLPIAVSVATTLGANPFSFVLAVTLSAATAFLSPVGYQTNLMVYGPGGYRFTDFIRVGLPLQLLTALVVTGGIIMIWGV